MCGIAGVFDVSHRLTADELTSRAKQMAGTLGHRGPDDQGIWIDPEAGFALAHTRLAIIDLSPAGAQPMVSSCGRFVLSYNGEIYNADELRKALEEGGRKFRGHSDTEVLVEACAQWGVEETVQRLIGMFAFALWDRAERRLCLVRDRLGIKPLYWGRQHGRILFASELTALETLPDFQKQIDRDAVLGFMRFAYVPAPRSIYAGIGKLAPGAMVSIFADGNAATERYWSLENVARRGLATRIDMSDEEATDALDDLLQDAVSRRLIADVPLGAFLSGGIDSSTVAALMQAKSSGAVRTYSIGFNERGFDEAPFAKAVADHLGTEHSEMRVTAEDALAVIPDLTRIYDEPFADSSQVPTALLARLTRRHVKVALSGDGGDELFAGYNRHRAAKLLSLVPPRIGQALGKMLGHAAPLLGDRQMSRLPRRFRMSQPGDKLSKLAAALQAGPEAAYLSAVSQWMEPAALVRGYSARDALAPVLGCSADVTEPTERMLFVDTLTYLPDDILTKVDRATMAVGLEARVPILDHRVVEFSWRLPMRFRIRNGETKWLLRRVLDRYVPPHLIERPKTGFGIPLAQWLRGPLRLWAEENLSVRRLQQGGLLNARPIRAAWEAHIAGTADHAHRLWAVLVLQDWRARRGV